MASKPLLLRKTPPIRGQPERSCGRSALFRIVHLHRRLAREQFVTSESLARELEVSSRTIKRDIDLLRDQLEAPIKWDPATHSYTYTRHYDLLPLLRIDAGEALALALAGRIFAAWGGSPLGLALTSALQKISPIVRGAVSLGASALENLLFSPEDPAAEAEHWHFATLLEAIHSRREMRVVYQKPKTDSPSETRILLPLHLAHLDHRWMLVAHDRVRHAPRNFLLSRIRNAMPTGRRFRPPPDFDCKRYLRGCLGRFAGDTEHDVKIAADAEIAPYLRERPWHASQRIVEFSGGRIEASFRLNHLNDIERRILACGAHAEVLAPPELRERIRKTAAALLANHQ
ncbi:MAG: transcriptional regulator [Opitutus sp.]